MSRGMHLEALAAIQVNADGGPDASSCSGRECMNWLDSRYIFKFQALGFSYGWNMEHERRRMSPGLIGWSCL